MVKKIRSIKASEEFGVWLDEIQKQTEMLTGVPVKKVWVMDMVAEQIPPKVVLDKFKKRS